MIENASNARRALWFAVLVSIAAIGGVSAQDFPTRPIRWIIGFPPGGPTDILVRLMGERLQARLGPPAPGEDKARAAPTDILVRRMGERLQARLGEPVLVENKPGAASNIATEAVVNAPPDGYTLGSVTSANAINATVNKRTLGFDYLKQLAPVAGMSQGPSVMVINPAVPAKNVAEFVAYAKANPGKLNMGTPGVGSTGHLAGELFKATAGVDLVHIPYRGAAPAMTHLTRGTGH